MKGDEMIRVTYLKGKKAGRSKAFTTNPFLHILFLFAMFVLSAHLSPQLGEYSLRLITGIAALLALPAVAYHFINAAKEFLAIRSNMQSEIEMNDFFRARSY